MHVTYPRYFTENVSDPAAAIVRWCMGGSINAAAIDASVALTSRTLLLLLLLSPPPPPPPSLSVAACPRANVAALLVAPVIAAAAVSTDNNSCVWEVKV